MVPRFDEPKTRASRRTISVPPLVLDELSGRASNFRQRVSGPAVRAAGLPPLHFHHLRHSAAALMIEMGAHIETIKRRLGHSSIRVTSDVYGSLLPAVDEEVASGLDDLLGRSPRVASVSRQPS